MLIYFLIAIWVGLQTANLWQPKHPGTLYRYTIHQPYPVTAALTFLFIAAVLAAPVTGDMSRYLAQLHLNSTLTMPEALASVRWEPGFVVYQWLVSVLTTSQTFFIGLTAMLMWVLLFFTLKKVVPVSYLPLLLFGYVSFFEYFNLATNIIRQGFVIHLMLLMIVMLKEDRYIKGILLVAAASLFHISGIITAGLLLIRKLRISVAFLIGALGLGTLLMLTGMHQQIMITVAGLVGGTVEDTVLRFTSDEFVDRYGGIVNRLDFLGFTLFWAVWGAAFYYLYLRKDEWYMWILKCYLALSVVFTLFAFIAYSDRIAMFAWFLVPILLFYPITRMTGRMKTAGIAGTILIAVLMVFFFDVTPYFARLPGY
ncbi:EpsG family protein [Alteribacter lacisalsi]|uniref:EpsG family protein n=1 Tax=Alteribacter lacisalsi TaxID=2045244 RepID=UPI001374E2CC|nr:EpsG family protein [Alteribacter lacisalsi]